MAHKGMDIGGDLNIKSCEAQWNGAVIWAWLRLEGSGFNELRFTDPNGLAHQTPDDEASAVILFNQNN